MSDPHLLEFLFTSNGRLTKKAHQIPALREYVQDLPETKATFHRREIDTVSMDNLHTILLEFVGAWPVTGYVEGKGNERFVNPNYAHAHRFSDVAVRCECGAKFTRNYEDGENALRDEHQHADDCKPYYRLRARADMAEKREAMIQRLTLMGWTGTDIAPRLGVNPNHVGGIAKSLGFSLGELRKAYKGRVGDSYRYAMCELDIGYSEMAAICGHGYSTLNQWSKQYGQYEPPENIEFQRTADGPFRWMEA